MSIKPQPTTTESMPAYVAAPTLDDTVPKAGMLLGPANELCPKTTLRPWSAAISDATAICEETR